MTELSLYEQVSDLSTIKKQWFVELFQGDALDTDRWAESNINGTNTFAISDSINGGFTITTGGSDSNSGIIDFNDIRQYSHNSSVFLGYFKKDITGSAVIGGFSSLGTAFFSTTECALIENGSHVTNIALETADATTATRTEGSIAVDTDYHLSRIDCGSSDIKMTLDGVLDVTKTTNRPTVKMQPRFGVQKRNSAGTTIGSIRYMECFNT